MTYLEHPFGIDMMPAPLRFTSSSTAMPALPERSSAMETKMLPSPMMGRRQMREIASEERPAANISEARLWDSSEKVKNHVAREGWRGPGC